MNSSSQALRSTNTVNRPLAITRATDAKVEGTIPVWSSLLFPQLCGTEEEKENKSETEWLLFTAVYSAGVLKQDPNTKKFKQMLIYFNTDTPRLLGHKQRLLGHAYNLPSTKQAVKTQPKQDKSFSFIFHRCWLFICCLSVILWLDKGDFSENLHTVRPC